MTITQPPSPPGWHVLVAHVRSPVVSLRVPISNGAPLEILRARLETLCYTERAIRERLGIWHPSAITLPEYPVYRERLSRREDALSRCISLFLLQGEIARGAVERALGARCAGALVDLGLLFAAGPLTLAASVSVYPCAGRYFISDHHFRPIPRAGDPPVEQQVMHLGQDSYVLANLKLTPPKGGRVLDLCTGSGVHGILAAPRARMATLVDINPRAVEFARANAMFNGVASRCEVRCASLYDAIDAGERFDLILANPPFVPSPRAPSDRILFQDGGPTGDAVLGPVLRGLHRHLTPRGVAAIVAMFAERRRSTLESTIRKLLGSRRPTEVVLLKLYRVAPEELAFWMTWRAFGDDFPSYLKRYQASVDNLRAARISNLLFGVLIVRPSASSSFRDIDLPLSRALSGVVPPGLT